MAGLVGMTMFLIMTETQVEKLFEINKSLRLGGAIGTKIDFNWVLYLEDRI